MSISELVGARAAPGRKREHISSEVLHRILSGRRVENVATKEHPKTAFTKVCDAIKSSNLKAFEELLKYEVTASKLSAVIIQHDIHGRNPFHLACSANNLDILRLLLNRSPSFRRQKALLERDNGGKTPIDMAVETEDSTMFSMMVHFLASEDDGWIQAFLSYLLQTHKHQFLQTVLENDTIMYQAMKDTVASEFIASESLKADDIRSLEPYSKNYIIPSKGETRPRGLVCYNCFNRDGAIDEANTFSESLQSAGFDTTTMQWSHFSDLREWIGAQVDDAAPCCSALFVTVMSHGFQGNLLGDDNSYGEVNEILDEITNGLRLQQREHIPVVLMVQACQRPSALRTDPTTDAETVAQASGCHIVLRRPHTLLLMAAMSERVAYRGEYTSALGDQLRHTEGDVDVIRIHTEAVHSMRRDQQPEMRSTLRHHLVLPAALSTDN